MGRLSQIFWFMNEEKMPTYMEIVHQYTHLGITDELKSARRKYRNTQKKLENQSLFEQDENND